MRDSRLPSVFENVNRNLPVPVNPTLSYKNFQMNCRDFNGEPVTGIFLATEIRKILYTETYTIIDKKTKIASNKAA